MNKIKINKRVETEIGVVSMLALMKGRTAHEYLDEFAESYKKRGDIDIFTADEIDSIMKVLESMPGYTPEKFFTACVADNNVEFNEMRVFQTTIYITYIMLSITNPELFEKDEEENNNG